MTLGCPPCGSLAEGLCSRLLPWHHDGPIRGGRGWQGDRDSSGTCHHPLFLESAWGDGSRQAWLGDGFQSPSDGTRETVCMCAHVGVVNALP